MNRKRHGRRVRAPLCPSPAARAGELTCDNVLLPLSICSADEASSIRPTLAVIFDGRTRLIVGWQMSS